MLQKSILFSSFFILITYHILIISKVISYKYVWGGRLKSYKEALIMEAIATLLVLVFLYITYMSFYENWANELRVFVGAFFLFSAFANLFAKSRFEKLFSLPITLIIGLSLILI